MRGMTAFGRSKIDNGRYEVSMELTSVNKRHLDISVRLPYGYQEAEGFLRRDLSSKMVRGQATLSVSIRPIAAEVVTSTINWPWVEGRVAALVAILDKYRCKCSYEQACLEVWRQENCFCKETVGLTPEIEDLLKKAFLLAYEQFNTNRKMEGAFLAQDLRSRIDTLRKALSTIIECSIGHVDKVRERLQGLIAQHIPSLSSDDRILREVILHVDKTDVSEEISRIEHHLNHFEESLREDEACGKLLEFILQELLREFNTLGAKTSITHVSTAVITAKTELEKMREQVQNAE